MYTNDTFCVCINIPKCNDTASYLMDLYKESLLRQLFLSFQSSEMGFQQLKVIRVYQHALFLYNNSNWKKAQENL